MSYKILTKNGIDNTNIDGARANHFNAGMRSGIVKGALDECEATALSSNVLTIGTGELRICGHQVIIDNIESLTINNTPASTQNYSLIAEIVVNSDSVPSFRLFYQSQTQTLIQDNLFATENGAGTYQLRMYDFSITAESQITNITLICDKITGGSSDSSENGLDALTYINGRLARTNDPFLNATLGFQENAFNRTPNINETFIVYWVNTTTNDVYITGFKVVSISSSGSYQSTVQWFYSINGEQGDTGPQGPAGENGQNGADGLDALIKLTTTNRSSDPTVGSALTFEASAFNRTPEINDTFIGYWINTTTNHTFIVGWKVNSKPVSSYMCNVQWFQDITGASGSSDDNDGSQPLIYEAYTITNGTPPHGDTYDDNGNPLSATTEYFSSGSFNVPPKVNDLFYAYSEHSDVYVGEMVSYLGLFKVTAIDETSVSKFNDVTAITIFADKFNQSYKPTNEHAKLTEETTTINSYVKNSVYEADENLNTIEISSAYTDTADTTTNSSTAIKISPYDAILTSDRTTLADNSIVTKSDVDSMNKKYLHAIYMSTYSLDNSLPSFNFSCNIYSNKSTNIIESAYIISAEVVTNNIYSSFIPLLSDGYIEIVGNGIYNNGTIISCFFGANQNDEQNHKTIGINYFLNNQISQIKLDYSHTLNVSEYIFEI